jgi:uncharacterized protein YuzE
MRIQYYADTDSLYIDFSARPSAESKEITDGVVLDYDAEGNIVGIDIDHASKRLELSDLTLSQLPSEVHIKKSA